MNSWTPEQYNMMAMNPGLIQPHFPPPHLPPDSLMLMRGPEWNQVVEPNAGLGYNHIAPIPPEDQDTTMEFNQGDMSNEQSQSNIDETNNQSQGETTQGSRGRQSSNHQGGNNKDSRWNKNRDKDNGKSDKGDRNRRPRSQDRNRDRSDRSDRSRNNRGRDNRERVSRFTSRNDLPHPGMPGGLGSNITGMMPYANMILGQQAAEIPNMPNMPQMPNMPNMPNIPNVNNMMPGMNVHPNMMGNMIPNMMPGMVDQNMIMAQHQMQFIASQSIYVQSGVLLPPISGNSVPSRRERPAGCRTIFVGGLPPHTGLDTITEIFQRFGDVDDVKIHKQGVCHVRFSKQEMVEQSFYLSGYRFKMHDQNDNEATTLFIDYALNRDDQYENEKQKREPTPPRIEQFTPTALAALTDKIKSDTDFAESAPTLAGWLEKGECNKKNANTFYSLIQASNNQVRRLYNDKMVVDEEFLNLKTTMKEKFSHIIVQFEQVAKILSAAKHKRASDHFSKQQRRNIEMWLKMTEDLENIREEFKMMFDDEETEKPGQKMVSAEKYEQLKVENDTLICELEGFRNVAHLAKDEAERKFEKFKAHYIAQQALQGTSALRPSFQGGIFPPLPPPLLPAMDSPPPSLFATPIPTPDDTKYMSQGLNQEAKLVTMLTAFLLAHPLGATLDYLASYVRSMVPNIAQSSVNNVLIKYGDIFARQAKDKWTFVLFDMMKQQGH